MNDRQLIEAISILIKQGRGDLVCALQDNTTLFDEVGEAAKKQFDEVADFELKTAITTSLRLKLKGGGELGVNYVGKKLSFVPNYPDGGKTEVYRVPPSKMNAAYLMKLLGEHFSQRKGAAAASPVRLAFASVSTTMRYEKD